MKNRIKLCLQVAWPTAAFVVLVMGFNFCAATDRACFEAGDRMFLAMAVLSFPSGFLGVALTLLVLGPPASVDQLNDYVTFWLIMAGAGYLQWFVIIPRLFAKPNITTLNLEETKTVSKVTAAELPLHHALDGESDEFSPTTSADARLWNAPCHQPLQMLPHEGRDLPRIYRFPRQLSSRVMAAG